MIFPAVDGLAWSLTAATANAAWAPLCALAARGTASCAKRRARSKTVPSCDHGLEALHESATVLSLLSGSMPVRLRLTPIDSHVGAPNLTPPRFSESLDF